MEDVNKRMSDGNTHLTRRALAQSVDGKTIRRLLMEYSIVYGMFQI